jgi:hypothetical protein
MSGDLERPHTPVGLVRVRGHCTFTWREPVIGGQRIVRILPSPVPSASVKCARKDSA